MKVVPLGDKVVLKRLATEEMTPGGIALPDVGREKSREGRVLSVGDGRLLVDGRRAAHDVQEGDRVLFNPFGGAEVVVDGEQLLIVDEDDILAVMR